MHRYVELLLEMMKVDQARAQCKSAGQRQLLLSADLARSTLLTYLIDIYHVSKSNLVLKKQILHYFFTII